MFRKLRCYFGLHTVPGPTKSGQDSFFYCEGKCGSYVRWEQDLPRYGYWGFFGKLKPFIVEVEDKQ